MHRRHQERLQFSLRCRMAGGTGYGLSENRHLHSRHGKRRNDDLDEYDFGEDEDDDEDEPAPEVDDDTGEVEARPLDDYLLDEDEPKKEDEE